MICVGAARGCGPYLHPVHPVADRPCRRVQPDVQALGESNRYARVAVANWKKEKKEEEEDEEEEEEEEGGWTGDGTSTTMRGG